jgi:hypothetical protein
MVRTFYDSNPELQLGENHTAYMWKPEFPLMRYRDSLFKTTDTAEIRLKTWASMGPLYSSYGIYLTKKYTLHFLRYYIGPNCWRYIAPPVAFLENYNGGLPTVRESAVKWFGYTNNQVKTSMNNGKVSILQFYPFLVCITNLLMLLGVLSYLLLKGWQYNTTFNKSIFLAGFAWIVNAVFSIFASPVSLRFQAFPALLGAIFSLLLIDWMVQLMQHMKLQSQQQSLAI